MSHRPELKTEAFELYLLGNSPAEIARELARRHAGEKTPGAKTVEVWAYTPVGGKTWSERRYAAEAAAQDAVTRDFVSAKSKLMAGALRIQQLQQDRVERAYESAEDSEPENLTQEVYALVNLTKSVDKMLDSKLAEEARRKDAIDCLIEACRRIVPSWDTLEVKIRQEFQRLVNAKAAPAQTAAASP